MIYTFEQFEGCLLHSGHIQEWYAAARLWLYSNLNGTKRRGYTGALCFIPLSIAILIIYCHSDWFRVRGRVWVKASVRVWGCMTGCILLEIESQCDIEERKWWKWSRVIKTEGRVTQDSLRQGSWWQLQLFLLQQWVSVIALCLFFFIPLSWTIWSQQSAVLQWSAGFCQILAQ